MGECCEASAVSEAGAESRLRGPMILAKVIVDAIDNKKQVSRIVIGVVRNGRTSHCDAGSELRLWSRDRASLSLSDEGRRDEAVATCPPAVCV